MRWPRRIWLDQNSTQFAKHLREPEGEQILVPASIVCKSATENLLCILKRCHNMVTAHIRFLVVRIAERNTRPAHLVIKHEPKEQPAFKQFDATNPPLLVH